MKKIFILGSKGMAGHVVYNYFKAREYNVVDLARSGEYFEPTYNFDLLNFDLLKSTLASEKPDYVINCIGVLNKSAEDHPDTAILLNSYLPHYLAKLGTELGFKLIHISTDCVFNGKKGGYTETDPKDGIGFYAQSKAMGEVDYGDHLTIRTSIIGPELKTDGIGLFGWFMKQKGEISGYSKAFWTGVTTYELAKAIEALITQNVKGLHHLVNGEKVNKYELLNLFKKVFDRSDVNISANSDYAVDKSLVKSPVLNYVVPSYQLMLEQMKDYMLQNKELYNQYLLN